MTKLRLSLVAAIAACLCICSTAKAANPAKAPGDTIVPQTDPLVIELDFFEGRSLGTGRSYIGLYDNKINGRIGVATGMVRASMVVGNDALKFENCDARIGEPTISKKGNRYSFTVRADDGHLFNTYRDSDWRLSITVYSDNSATVDIESESIGRVSNSRLWHISGHVNKERTDALKAVWESEHPTF